MARPMQTAATSRAATRAASSPGVRSAVSRKRWAAERVQPSVPGRPGSGRQCPENGGLRREYNRQYQDGRGQVGSVQKTVGCGESTAVSTRTAGVRSAVSRKRWAAERVQPSVPGRPGSGQLCPENGGPRREYSRQCDVRMDPQKNDTRSTPCLNNTY